MFRRTTTEEEKDTRHSRGDYQVAPSRPRAATPVPASDLDAPPRPAPSLPVGILEEEDPEQMLQAMLRSAAAEVGARSALLTRGPESDPVEVIAAWSEAGAPQRLRPGGPPAPEGDDRSLSAALGLPAAITEPLALRREPHTWLVLAHKSSGPFTESDRRRARDLVPEAAVVAGIALRMVADRRAAVVLRRRADLWTAAARAVSHDLRTPLTTIVAALQTMARSGLDLAVSDTRSLLDSALAQADRMRRAADDLLLASGEKARRVPVPAEQVLVIVRSATGTGESAPPEVRIDPALPEITTDVHHLERALTDLIGGRHGAADAISVKNRSAGLAIVITPAPPEDRSAFAKQLIESAGGHIEWTGDTVTVTLPRRIPVAPESLV